MPRKAFLLFIALTFLVPVLPALGNGRIARAEGNFVAAASTFSGLVDPSGNPFFIFGVNYEGHTDRAWKMWQNEYFDPQLIDQDFAKAREAGFNTARIFIQSTVRDDVNKGDFNKLDSVFDLARKHQVYLLLTFNDYGSRDLASVAAVDAKIAQRYGGDSILLGYDLRNEPQFGEIALAIYPDDRTVPLQTDELIQAYGERMSRAAVASWRQTSDGRATIPAGLNDDQAYVYANVYKLYQEFLSAAGDWVGSHSGKSTLDYMDSPDISPWRKFLEGVDSTLATWIDVQAQAIRAVDSNHLITIGYSNAVLAKLPSNQALGMESFHRFPSPGYNALINLMKLMDNLKASFAGKPVLLEEFGYSNTIESGSDYAPVDQTSTSVHETALWLYLRSRGFAGGLKWMLNNYSQGYDPYENDFGVLDNNYQEKTVFYAAKALTASGIWAPTGDGGDLQSIQPDSDTYLSYLYHSGSSLAASGRAFQNDLVSYKADDPGQFFLSWQKPDNYEIRVTSTVNASIDLNLAGVAPEWYRTRPPQLMLDSGTGVGPALTRSGDKVTFQASANQPYLLVVPWRPPAFAPATALESADVTYFPQTQHNLGFGFRYYWEHNGGLDVFGYPVSEEFQENGRTVQYFERARFEYHPEFQGTPYETELGLLGSSVTTGRSFDQTPSFPDSPDRRYFAETGHSLSFGFKYYWERNGGLDVFGYPISEEFSETNPIDGKVYTVQYFERARFEYHPEFQGTPYETEMGQLGVQYLRNRGWLD